MLQWVRRGCKVCKLWQHTGQQNMTNKVTVREAAEALDISKTHVWTLIKKGTLIAVRTTPNKTKVLQSSIDALIKANNA